jgi:hypothetical protein
MFAARLDRTKRASRNADQIISLQFNKEMRPMQSQPNAKTYGTVAVERQNEMSGLEFVKAWPTGRCR